MAVTYKEEVTLVSEECITCGVIFGVPETLIESLKRNGGFFHCPNGHAQGWNEGTEQKARKKAERALHQERQQHDQTRAALDESEKKRKRIEERIANGVCPCCNRSFKNVRRHMKSKHPEFV